jgi:hypothetical protein
MKLILSVITIVTSLSTMASASVCDSEKNGLLWANDQIISQYECQNAKTILCATKAVFGSDNEKYVVVAGSVNTDKGHSRINALAWISGGKEGSVSEDNSLLELTYTPVAAIIIDNHKFRYEFNLNKKSGAASYTEESKKTLSLSGWSTLVSENLNCNKIK